MRVEGEGVGVPLVSCSARPSRAVERPLLGGGDSRLQALREATGYEPFARQQVTSPKSVPERESGRLGVKRYLLREAVTGSGGEDLGLGVVD